MGDRSSCANNRIARCLKEGMACVRGRLTTWVKRQWSVRGTFLSVTQPNPLEDICAFSSGGTKPYVAKVDFGRLPFLATTVALGSAVWHLLRRRLADGSAPPTPRCDDCSTVGTLFPRVTRSSSSLKSPLSSCPCPSLSSLSRRPFLRPRTATAEGPVGSSALAVLLILSSMLCATSATGLLVAPKAVRGLPPRHLRVDMRVQSVIYVAVPAVLCTSCWF